MQKIFSMKQPIILMGSGGHCVSTIDVIEHTGLFEIIGILDAPEMVGKKVLQYSVIGTDDDIEKFSMECPNFHVTVGQISTSLTRESIYNKVKRIKGILPTIISPFSQVSRHANLKEGTIIMHHALVNANAKIGRCCIINSKALIEHDALVGDFCHISTGAIINGQVNIGNGCFIGSNTVVGNNIEIADNIIISAGSQVLKNINLSGTYIGQPLRKIR